MAVKPELTLSGFTGQHNDDYMGTHDRLVKGATWKKQRIVSIMPSGPMIPPKVYLSHCSLVFPPNQQVARILAEGMEVGHAYSETISEVLKHPDLSQWEYILTIEHDNTPPPDGVLMLIESMEAHPEYDAISGLYFLKGAGGCAQVWGDPKDPVLNFRPQIPRQNEVQECCGLGMGFVLYRMSMFKDVNLRRPWFKTQADSGGCATQDLYFWQDARKNGHRCAVDTRVRVGHYDHSGAYGPAGMTW